MPSDIQTAQLPELLHREAADASGSWAFSGYGLGLGKTVTTLTAVKELKYHRFQVCKVLVIAPKKVAEATWSREAEKWDHLRDMRVSTVLGSRIKREKALARPADLYVINRENVEWLVDYYRNDWPFDMVVIDESSSFKDQSTKRWKALKRVRPKIHRIVLLTGTPAPNTLIDLWAQLYLLDEAQGSDGRSADSGSGTSSRTSETPNGFSPTSPRWERSRPCRISSGTSASA